MLALLTRFSAGAVGNVAAPWTSKPIQPALFSRFAAFQVLHISFVRISYKTHFGLVHYSASTVRNRLVEAQGG